MSATDSATSRRTIVDDVTERLLAILRDKDVFDECTIEELAELAASGDLSNRKQVEDIVKSDSRRTGCGCSE